METIDRILTDRIRNPVGPEFMAPSEVPAVRSSTGKIQPRATSAAV
jgi:hypothetical protein